MKKFYVALLALSLIISANAQHSPQREEAWKSLYRESAPIENALVHTRLEVSFDFDKCYLHGKAQITLKPHFYATDKLVLDAKGMDIHKVVLMGSNTPLKYQYDSTQLHIQLNKTYQKDEQYKIAIDYTAKPNEYKADGSAAITDARGLYFINPKGTEKDKPTQIWTQGEPESNSVWFPTLDKPNQKTTQEIYMTVPSKYVTLSNGALISQKNNNNGTRTDYWKMDKPHAPYLFFMGVGDYAVVKDKYKNIDVHYYVEKEFEKVARKIFGGTPEMIGFFSKLLNFEYPWNKYHQLVARDYVSGAMENTTAVIHGEMAQQDARELVDENRWEGVIVHELFHHWFGDLTTTESWSNLTVNESFANYSEYLWYEHKYSKDYADAHNYEEMMGYINSGSESKDLVRFYYERFDDMFDAVSYNKGGRILHMLRNHVGDDAFFASLNLFLTRHKYQAVEAHQLRLCFEEVTGRDLNWFFNQWYFGNGHPILDIKTSYDATTKKVHLIVTQEQEGDKIFKLPVAVDVYHGNQKVRHQIWVQHKTDSFSFDAATAPTLVNFDGDKVLLAQKKENKTGQEYLQQYTVAGKFLDRLEAIEWASKNATTPEGAEILKKGLADKFSKIKIETLQNIIGDVNLVKANLAAIETLAEKDPSTLVRSEALGILTRLNDQKYLDLFKKSLTDSSYAVAASSLNGLSVLEPSFALTKAIELKDQKVRGKLAGAVMNVLMSMAGEQYYSEIVNHFRSMPLNQEKFNMVMSYTQFLGTINDTQKFKEAFDVMEELKQQLKKYGLDQVINQFYTRLKSIKSQNMSGSGDTAALQEQLDYINKHIK